MKTRLNKQFQPQGVEIADVMIQDVVLPDDIAMQMSNKTLVRSKQEYEVMEQQFQMQSITLSNKLDQAKLDLDEKGEKLKVEGSRDLQVRTLEVVRGYAIRE